MIGCFYLNTMILGGSNIVVKEYLGFQITKKKCSAIYGALCN